jgi:hypothetical protein|tara:strand:- start:22 stop:519 length:498 start_codon:yes stop_codon:yes gene_type:complete
MHEIQIRSLIGNTLKDMGEKFDNPNAVELLYATGLVESKYRYIKQHPTGPARSFWQLETNSVIDNIISYLSYRKTYRNDCAKASFTDPSIWEVPGESQKSQWIADWEQIIESNMRAAIIHARLIYWRSPSKLPPLDPVKMGEYWVKYYNRGGKGSVEKFLEVYDG